MLTGAIRRIDTAPVMLQLALAAETSLDAEPDAGPLVGLLTSEGTGSAAAAVDHVVGAGGRGWGVALAVAGTREV